MTKHRTILAVGLGSIFEHAHFPILKELLNPRFIYGVEVSSARCRYWKMREPSITIFQDLEDALEKKEYDCAIVACYPRDRYKILKQLYYAGIKRALCEKPLDTTYHGLNEIQNLINKEDFIVIPCHTWAYSPQAIIIERFLKKNWMGPPFYINTCVERTGPAVGAPEGKSLWRINPQLSGGGILFDHGYHQLYLVQRWTNEIFSPIEVKAWVEQNGIDWVTRSIFLGSEGSSLKMFLTWKGNTRSVKCQITSNHACIILKEEGVWFTPNNKQIHKIFQGKPLSAEGYHKSWYENLYKLFFSSCSDDIYIRYLMKEALLANKSILDAYQKMEVLPEVDI